jgi:hypothetical protein
MNVPLIANLPKTDANAAENPAPVEYSNPIYKKWKILNKH